MVSASPEASTLENRHIGISTYSDWSQPCWVSPALLWISFYLIGISCTDNLLIPEACKQFHLCEDLDQSQDQSAAATKDQSTSTPNEGLLQLTGPPSGSQSYLSQQSIR